MSKSIIADEQMQAKLGNGDEPVMICSADGTVLGYFTPTTPAPRKLNLQPQVSDEELTRREKAGGGRKLADILSDLEKRG